jgi:hypothetical protein
MRKEWEREWEEYEGGRQTKLFFPKTDKSKSKEIVNFGRHKAGRIVRFCTGHNALKYHLYNIGVSEDAECRFCENGTETSWHIAAECPVFINTIREITAAKSFQGEWNVSELVKVLEIEGIDRALDGWEREHDVWEDW